MVVAIKVVVTPTAVEPTATEVSDHHLLHLHLAMSLLRTFVIIRSGLQK
jgi:hypothetical protein